MYPKAKEHAENADIKKSDSSFMELPKNRDIEAKLAIYEQVRSLTQVMESINNTLIRIEYKL